MVCISEVLESAASMAIPDIPPPSDVVSDLLTGGLDISPFEVLLVRPEESVGVLSLFYSPLMAQLIISLL